MREYITVVFISGFCSREGKRLVPKVKRGKQFRSRGATQNSRGGGGANANPCNVYSIEGVCAIVQQYRYLQHGTIAGVKH